MPLIWFISGILFSIVAMPIINSLTDLIIAWLETKRMKCAEAINNSNINMQKAATSVEEEIAIMQPVGFTLSGEEEEYNDENI